MSNSLILDIDDIWIKKQNKIIEIQEEIEEYDKELYKITSTLDQKSYDMELTTKANNIINQRNDLVDEFKLQYQGYIDFENNKIDPFFNNNTKKDLELARNYFS